jgi:hypothetical protein
MVCGVLGGGVYFKSGEPRCEKLASLVIQYHSWIYNLEEKRMKWIVNVTKYVVVAHRTLCSELIIRGKDKSHGYMQSGVCALRGIVLNLRQSCENAEKTVLTALTAPWFSSGKVISGGRSNLVQKLQTAEQQAHLQSGYASCSITTRSSAAKQETTNTSSQNNSSSPISARSEVVVDRNSGSSAVLCAI